MHILLYKNDNNTGLNLATVYNPVLNNFANKRLYLNLLKIIFEKFHKICKSCNLQGCI